MPLENHEKARFLLHRPSLKEFRRRTSAGSTLTSDNAPNVAGMRSLGACRPSAGWVRA